MPSTVRRLKQGSGNRNSCGAPDLETFNFFHFKKCYVGNGLRVFLIQICVLIQRCVNLTHVEVCVLRCAICKRCDILKGVL